MSGDIVGENTVYQPSRRVTTHTNWYLFIMYNIYLWRESAPGGKGGVGVGDGGWSSFGPIYFIDDWCNQSVRWFKIK